MKYGNRTRAEGAIHPRPERRGFSRIQVKLEPVGNLSYYEMAKKITTYLQKGRNKNSSPEKVLTGFPKFMATMSISPVHILGCENDYGLAPVIPESAPDLAASLRSIQGSCPWAF